MKKYLLMLKYLSVLFLARAPTSSGIVVSISVVASFLVVTVTSRIVSGVVILVTVRVLVLVVTLVTAIRVPIIFAGGSTIRFLISSTFGSGFWCCVG